ncbi:MAG: pyrophosphohydrolase [Acidimicrobiia bacterium]
MTDLARLQELMEDTYGARDRARGVPATVAWLAEEIGELAKAARKGTRRSNSTSSATASPGWRRWRTSSTSRWTTRCAHANGRPRCGAVPCACP